MRVFRLFCLIALLACIVPAFAQETERSCNTMEHLELQKALDPEVESRMRQIEQFTEEFAARQGQSSSRVVVTIPVVVHVVYNTTAENISDAQILSQITVLNADFRRLNSDANNTWSQAADAEVEFCLASVDPSGNATTGITRTSTTATTFSYTNDNVKKSNQGGKDPWPAGSYLNLWVCDLGSGLLGYAQFPGGAASTDGVVCDYAYFGTVGVATAPFNLGRTATHEVGHWLNLFHIWGDDGTSCTAGSDQVADTPNQADENYGCPSGSIVSCSNGPAGDMYQNYMDYTDDACMNLFTAGQKTRMQAVLAPGGARASLLNSAGCGGGGTAPTCTDGVQNGQETGVDCGGPTCPACPVVTCSPPTNVTATNIARRSATISWSASPTATNYTVFWKRTTAATYSSANTSSLTYNLTGLTRNAGYQYYVRANCPNSQTAVSATLTFNTLARMAGDVPAMHIYPNPGTGHFEIEFGNLEGDYVDIAVMDIMGRVVAAYPQTYTGDSYMSMDLTMLKDGVYFISLMDEDGERYLEKVVIAH